MQTRTSLRNEYQVTLTSGYVVTVHAVCHTQVYEVMSEVYGEERQGIARIRMVAKGVAEDEEDFQTDDEQFCD